MPRTRAVLLALLPIAKFVIAAPDDGDARELNPFGPFPSIQVDTMSLLFYQATPARADPLGAGNFRVSADVMYSEHEVSDWNDTARFHVHRDHELMRVELRGEVGLSDDLDLEIVLPFRYLTFGVLSDFIDAFHDVTGLGPEGSRMFFRDDAEIRSRVFHQGREDLFTISDLPIGLKYAVLRDGRDPIGLALRAGIELPTGSPSRSTGSGKVDGGVGVVLQKTLGSVTLYLSADGQFQQTPARFEAVGIDVEPAIAATTFSAEWRIAKSFALSAQLQYAQNLIDTIDVSSLADDRLVIGVGFWVGIGRHFAWRFQFVEDIFSAPSFDVMFHTGLSYQFR